MHFSWHDIDKHRICFEILYKQNLIKNCIYDLRLKFWVLANWEWLKINLCILITIVIFNFTIQIYNDLFFIVGTHEIKPQSLEKYCICTIIKGKICIKPTTFNKSRIFIYVHERSYNALFFGKRWNLKLTFFNVQLLQLKTLHKKPCLGIIIVMRNKKIVKLILWQPCW